ncbi:MAG: NAD(P)H-flavin reductase [Gammaproteobacteria bacterium]|nr:NAD(P)H-flavin reductase [Gammaproteobacteria bacterium]
MQYQCPIESISYFNGDTRKVVLGFPDGGHPEFKAGQYLEIILPADGKRCPFSIASAPTYGPGIELHVRPTPDSSDSDQIEKLLNECATLTVEIPKGNCFLETAPNGPLLMLAASTGITQMKSIIEHLLPAGLRHPVYLYWGVLVADDLYLSALMDGLTAEHPNLHYVPVVSEPERSPGWEGRTGLVGNAALDDLTDLSDLTVYVGGSPGMVYATLDKYVERGLPKGNMYSDVFSYAPRKR